MKKLIILFAVGLFLFACAQPPVEEMNRAIETLSRAENDADAVKYSSNYLSRAREAVTRMREEADSKRFDAARNYAADAVSYAERAMREGSAGAARAREEAANLLDSLKTPLSETEANLNAVNGLKNGQQDLSPLGGMLDSAKGTYENAQQDLSAGDSLDAIDKGNEVRSILGNINAQISGAVSAGKK
jgi:predicted S18 family serine protease